MPARVCKTCNTCVRCCAHIPRVICSWCTLHRSPCLCKACFFSARSTRYCHCSHCTNTILSLSHHWQNLHKLVPLRAQIGTYFITSYTPTSNPTRSAPKLRMLFYSLSQLCVCRSLAANYTLHAHCALLRQQTSYLTLISHSHAMMICTMWSNYAALVEHQAGV